MGLGSSPARLPELPGMASGLASWGRFFFADEDAARALERRSYKAL
jgi:hypothetical protein